MARRNANIALQQWSCELTNALKCPWSFGHPSTHYRILTMCDRGCQPISNRAAGKVRIREVSGNPTCYILFDVIVHVFLSYLFSCHHILVTVTAAPLDVPDSVQNSSQGQYITSASQWIPDIVKSAQRASLHLPLTSTVTILSLRVNTRLIAVKNPGSLHLRNPANLYALPFGAVVSKST
jgi:hypothetical protein